MSKKITTPTDLTSLKLNSRASREMSVGDPTDDGLIPVIFSTETPTLEYDLRGNPYLEVFDHGKGSVDLSGLRKDNRVTFLESHIAKPMVVLGSVKDIEILHDKRIGIGVLEFSDSQRGQDAKKDFLQGHREYVSVGATRVMPPISVSRDKDSGLLLVRLKWKLIDVSGVHEPADLNAKISATRSASDGGDMEILEIPLKTGRSKAMTPEEIAAAKQELADQAAALKLKEDAFRAKSEDPAKQTVTLGEDKAKRELERREAIDGMVHLGVTGMGLDYLTLNTEAERMKASNDDPGLFKAFLISKKAEKSAMSPDDKELGMTGKEQVRFSFTKALRALHEGKFRADNKDCSFEFEVSQQADKATQQGCVSIGATSERSLTIPADIANGYARRDAMTANDIAFIAKFLPSAASRAMSVDQATKGGNWTGEGMTRNRFIDFLNNATIADQINITRLGGLTTDITFAKLDDIQTAYMRGQHEDATLSDLTTSTRKMSPSLLSAGTKISYLLALQASALGIEMLLEQKLALAQALKRNMQLIYGTGKNKEILGIAVNSGINVVAGGANGLAPTVDNYINMRTEVNAANAAALNGQESVFIMNSVTIGKNQRTAIESGQTERIMAVNVAPGQEKSCIGHRVIESNILRSNLTKGSGTDLSEALFLNPSQIFEGRWGPIRVLVDEKTAAASDEKITYIHEYLDYMVGHGEAVSYMNDLITT